MKKTRSEIVKLWTSALRSGEYKQTSGCLHNGDGYCCLGVLCDIASKNGLNIQFERVRCDDYWDEDEIFYDELCFDSAAELLPESVMKWAGLRSNDGAIEGQHQTLAELNDKNISFNDIADTIEKFQEKIFE